MALDVTATRIHMESYGGAVEADTSVSGIAATARVRLGGRVVRSTSARIRRCSMQRDPPAFSRRFPANQASAELARPSLQRAPCTCERAWRSQTGMMTGVSC